MKQFVLGAALVDIGTIISALFSNDVTTRAKPKFALPGGRSGVALWHLPGR